MAAASRSDRNRDAIAQHLAEVLAVQSVPGYYGKGGIEWTLSDGLIVLVTPKTARETRVGKGEKDGG
jgi:hypothetical protein